ncbi:helix-turn-helix transcriptional regulator [Aquirufa nivalisilvae]
MNTTEKLKTINNLLLQKSFKVNYENVVLHFAEHFDVGNYSQRSFFRDIKNLKEAIGLRYPTFEDELGPLLRFSKYEDRYYYVRDDISAFPSLSEKELTQIASIIDFNKHLFTDNAGQGVVNKLRAISLENSLSEYNEILPWPAIQLIKDGERSGSDQLKKLIECISAKKTIQLHHQGLSKTSKLKTITGLPVMIKEYNNGWYTGWYLLFYEITGTEMEIEPTINELRLLALDRIKSVIETKIAPKVKLCTLFNPPDYFKYSFGIIRNNIGNPTLEHEKITVKLEADNWINSYLEKYPLHFTQNIQILNKETKEGILELEMEINQELESFILKYTDQMTVIGPENLKVTIIDKLHKSLNNYQLSSQLI